MPTKILCAKSGIQYTSEYFSIDFSGREISHPIFHASHKTLRELTHVWADGNLPPAESYLLYLALFNSTQRVDFRSPATFTSDTLSIVANNMESLSKIVEVIWAEGPERVNEVFHLPYFVVTGDTNDLSCTGDWISIWNSCYKDFQDSYKSSTLQAKISHKEDSLEKHIKDKTKDISSYASQLASWASLAASFPTEDAGSDMLKIMGKSCTLDEYWRAIIVACARGDTIFKFPIEDVEELIGECEEFIPQGSIYSFTLLTLLREGRDKLNSFFNLGDIDLGRNGDVGFRILDANSSVEDANKLALIASAPQNEPQLREYPNKLAFLKAKMNWKLKQEHEASLKYSNEMQLNATLLSKI